VAESINTYNMSLTARQQAIYDFIVEFRRMHGCSPSIPEIQKAFLIRSPNGVVGHLLALEAKGYIRRSRRGSRQVDVVKENPALAQHSALFNLPVFTSVPGEADAPLTARGAEACVTLDRSALGFRPRPGTFVLKVHGDAMKQAGISDGDLVIVEPCQEAQAGQIHPAAPLEPLPGPLAAQVREPRAAGGDAAIGGGDPGRGTAGAAPAGLSAPAPAPAGGRNEGRCRGQPPPFCGSIRELRGTLMRNTQLLWFTLAALAAPLWLGCQSAPQPPEEGMVPLFDGRTLNGWKQLNGKATYKVEDGMIVGTTVPGSPNSFLCTTKNYGDFILEFEVKVDPELNSGVQIRSHQYEHDVTVHTMGSRGPVTRSWKAGRVHGYQVEISNEATGTSGGIYDEARRGWLANIKDDPAASKAFKDNQWNKYRIEAIGDSIKTFVNGVPCADGATCGSRTSASTPGRRCSTARR